MGKRIIVADSDSVVQQVASYFLKLEGFDVEAVGDGVSVMKAIEKSTPDVIVMTPVLPGINGVEVSRFVRENRQYKGIPIIFLAESEEPLLNDIPDLSQAFGIINKPIDPTKLVNTIKEYLENGAVPEKDIAESLKSIEELLGWDVSDKKMVKNTEEVLHGKSIERSFDVTEMLAGNINVPEKDTFLNPEASFTDEDPVCNPVCHPEFISGSQAMPDEEIPKLVRDDRGQEGLSDATHVGVGLTSEHEDAAPDFMAGTKWGMNPHATEVSDKGGFEAAEHVEADLKNRVTDEMIENMVRKIAVDVVERVTRELVPDIAEREIIKEIERLKGIE